MLIGYIDPSVMTFAIQAIAGVAIAVAAFVGVKFRKAKKKVDKKLGIDENKNKKVESDDIFDDEDEEEEEEEIEKKETPKKKQTKKK